MIRQLPYVFGSGSAGTGYRKSPQNHLESRGIVRAICIENTKLLQGAFAHLDNDGGLRRLAMRTDRQHPTEICNGQ